MPSDPIAIHESPALPKPSVIKNYGWTLLAASAFPTAFVCAGLWLISVIQIPTGQDARKAFEFRTALVQKLEPYHLEDLDKVMKIQPLRGGRGRIVMQGPITLSKWELELFRKEFDQLNINGHFTLDLR